MNKWIMVVDVTRCNNCQNCVVAVKDEHVGNDFPGYAVAQPASGHEWITVDRRIRGSGSMVDVTYVPRMCNHCDNAPCIRAGAGAITKRDDGIVLIDPVKAKGRRDLVEACPYGAIWWNDERDVPQHWTFDAHLLDAGWKEPRCVQACPSGALRAERLSDADVQALAAREELAVLQPALGTQPRVFYKGLAMTETCFIGGNVVAMAVDGTLVNVPDADVELSVASGGAVHHARATTDVFGDFKIDGLSPQGGTYSIAIRHASLGVAQGQGTHADSVYLGTFTLHRSH